MDNFKYYIRSQRDEMDIDTPADAVWEGITAEQQFGKAKRIKMIWGYAAAACITALVVLSILFFNQHKAIDPAGNVAQTKHDGIPVTEPAVPRAMDDTTDPARSTIIPIVPKEKPTLAVAAKHPAKTISSQQQPGQSKTKQATEIVSDLQNNYAQLVNMQISKLNKMPIYTVAPGYFNTYKIQLKQLDEDEASLKKDIKQHGLNGLLLEQLININQQKLNLLKTLQSEINKINNQVKTTGPGVDSIKTSFLNI